MKMWLKNAVIFLIILVIVASLFTIGHAFLVYCHYIQAQINR